jgi:diguanylate cyclase (GGDEF)-like protein
VQASDRLGKRAVPAIVLLIVLSFVLMAGLLVHIAVQQDHRAAEQARAFAQAALDRRKEIIAKEVKDYAAWGEAYQHLHAITDVDWAYAQQNLGRTLYADLGYDDVLVVGPGDAVTYAVVSGELATTTKAVLEGRALDSLIRGARMASPGESKPVTGYVVADGLTYLVATTAITTGGDPTIPLRAGLPSVLVFADALTPSRLAEIGGAAFVRDLAVDLDPRVASGPERFLVRTADGNGEVAFRWTPEQPGKGLLELVLPCLATAGVGFSVLVFLILRRAVVTARLIERNAQALAEAHQRAEHMSLHDAVTGLANRTKLGLFLDTMLRRIEPPDCGAVLYIDLDRFKKINDELGHRAGDVVLIETAARLRMAVSDRDLVSRMGGDEFVVILSSLKSPIEAERVGRRLLKDIQRPIAVEGTVATVGLSIGIAIATDRTVTADEVLRQADLAMYEAKMAGGDACRLYSARSRDEPQCVHFGMVLKAL